MTFSERLKIAIEKLNISQAEAARRCGITQQSMNYMISKNISSSKLAPKISSALEINPEWLIYGEGRFKETRTYEVPILSDVYSIIKMMNNDLDTSSHKYTVIDYNLGNLAFAYLLKPNEIIICKPWHFADQSTEYFEVNQQEIHFITAPNENSFTIYEWRRRNVDI